ncbi:hypothetical protein [Streptomyces sp. NBC_01264]|uniref:hypothetical protein n=1 Tax=Streptomyces sp. NBC_01264 TaxID=2903804 RepID=UPI002259246E|nr:hypothetical protein [Streptomyces sp. NBC_01264]MCX4780114.1 hypothetical protein [Streptomyces sp. NBC_01264]
MNELKAPPPEIATHDPNEIAGLWADAKRLYLAEDYPPYASPAWQALHPDDPARLASVLEAAELWRKQWDALEYLPTADWYAHVYGDARRLTSQVIAATNRLRAYREIQAARSRREPHTLEATPGWPPIAIPGQPGRWLTHRQEMAA